ncbi:unnamed protein product [Rotaria sp. Silwood1]|nr:unnamed protein product [Rotaria sp. Silwood1]CAF1650625.1 unnamed protein product [Rotaria sp. Silwood1]
MDIHQSVIQMYEELINNTSNESNIKMSPIVSLEQDLNDPVEDAEYEEDNNCNSGVNENTNTNRNNDSNGNNINHEYNEHGEVTEDILEIVDIPTSM